MTATRALIAEVRETLLAPGALGGLLADEVQDYLARLADALEEYTDLYRRSLNERQELGEWLRAAEAERDRWMEAVRSGPCRCDPPGSGEELCSGGCELRAELEDREKILAAAQRAGATILAERDAARAALAKYGRHLPRCTGWGKGPCECGLAAALEAQP